MVDHKDISVMVMDAYILGRLKEVKDNRFEGTVEQGFQQGIFHGSEIAELSGGITSVMKYSIEGLKMQDPGFGLTTYAEPKPELGEERGRYLSGFAKGLTNSLEVVTRHHKETITGYVRRALQKLELEKG